MCYVNHDHHANHFRFLFFVLPFLHASPLQWNANWNPSIYPSTLVSHVLGSNSSPYIFIHPWGWHSLIKFLVLDHWTCLDEYIGAHYIPFTEHHHCLYPYTCLSNLFSLPHDDHHSLYIMIIIFGSIDLFDKLILLPPLVPSWMTWLNGKWNEHHLTLVITITIAMLLMMMVFLSLILGTWNILVIWYNITFLSLLLLLLKQLASQTTETSWQHNMTSLSIVPYSCQPNHILTFKNGGKNILKLDGKF